MGTEYILHLEIQNTTIKVFRCSLYLVETLAEKDYICILLKDTTWTWAQRKSNIAFLLYYYAKQLTVK